MVVVCWWLLLVACVGGLCWWPGFVAWVGGPWCGVGVGGVGVGVCLEVLSRWSWLVDRVTAFSQSSTLYHSSGVFRSRLVHPSSHHPFFSVVLRAL